MEQSGRSAAAKAGLRGSALLSSAMVAGGRQARMRSSPWTAEPKQQTACLCSSALLPLPSPPSALHPQTQKHSRPGLSPAACSSPGFAAQCKAPRSRKHPCAPAARAVPCHSGVYHQETGDLQKNTVHSDPGDGSWRSRLLWNSSAHRKGVSFCRGRGCHQAALGILK